MSRSYRDWLNERGVPKGPWIVRKRDSGIEARRGETNEDSALSRSDESPGAAKTAIAKTASIHLFKAKNHV